MDKQELNNRLDVHQANRRTLAELEPLIETAPERGDKDKPRLSEVMKAARQSYEERLLSGELKATVSDYIKLLEFERKLAEEKEEKPTEITITWVEPESDSSEE